MLVSKAGAEEEDTEGGEGAEGAVATRGANVLLATDWVDVCWFDKRGAVL